MVTTPIALVIYTRLITAPQEWFDSPDGRRLLAKSLWHIRQHEGRQAARDLRDTLYASLAVCGASDIP